MDHNSLPLGTTFMAMICHGWVSAGGGAWGRVENISVVNCDQEGREELKEGDDQIWDHGWVVGEGLLDHSGPPEIPCVSCKVALANISGRHLFLSAGEVAGGLVEMQELDLRDVTEDSSLKEQGAGCM